MNKGDSFFIPDVQQKSVAGRLRLAAERIGAKLTTRIEGNGVRVWRVK